MTENEAREVLAMWDRLPPVVQVMRRDTASSALRAARWPHPMRVLVALRLARDVETCRDLLDGRPVEPARIDQTELRWARDHELVRLDFHAIDLLANA